MCRQFNFMKVNIKNFIYHHATKSCCHSYILVVFWIEREAWTGRSHPAWTLFLLKQAAIVRGLKKKAVLTLKSSGESTFAFDKTVWGLIGPWQLRKCAQQPFPFSCLCFIPLGGSGSCFQVVPYSTSQLSPAWLPQVWRGWEWVNRGISRLGLTWGTGNAAQSLSRSLACSTLMLPRGLELSFDHHLLQIRKSCSCWCKKVLDALMSYVLCPGNNWLVKCIWFWKHRKIDGG